MEGHGRITARTGLKCRALQAAIWYTQTFFQVAVAYVLV